VIGILQNRFRNAALATRHEANGVMEDVRLFARIRNGHCAFRQSCIDGMRVLVRADEDVGRDIYFLREFEPQESAFVFENVRESDVCLDIGANIGFYTLGFGKRASRGAVHAFEPAPLNYHVLAVNVLANNLSNVVMNNCAVGDTNGEVTFCIAEDGAFSSFLDTGRKAITRTAMTRVVSLDSYCSECNLTHLDILKVDVEGAEPAVLRGAAGLLADPERRPRLVMLELFDPMLRQFGSTIGEVEALMRTYGYEPFVFIKDRRVPFSQLHHDRFYNVLFLDNTREHSYPGH
jgi:FkbM family methyltransferase